MGVVRPLRRARRPHRRRHREELPRRPGRAAHRRAQVEGRPAAETLTQHQLGNSHNLVQSLPVAVEVDVVLRDGRHQELLGGRRWRRRPVRRRLLVLRGQDWNLIGDPTVGGFLRDGPLDQVKVLEVDAIVLFFFPIYLD